jgi:transposase-like protein
MKLMGRPSSYPKELRERAVRMVLETKSEYAMEFAAITSISRRLGIGSSETLRKVGAPRGGRCRAAAGGDERGVRADQGA